MRPARLGPVHGIEGLVEEESNRPAEVDPGRAVGVQSRVIPEHGQNVHDYEAEAAQRDLPWLSITIMMHVELRVLHWVCPF